MQQVFISVVSVLHSMRDIRLLSPWLEGVYSAVNGHYSDFELVLVNNGLPVSEIDRMIEGHPEALRKNIFLLNLSTAVDKNNAMVAGLDRANGDYTLIFETDFYEHPGLIHQMWDQCRNGGADIAYLQAQKRKAPILPRVFYNLFYFILRRFSGLAIDPWAHHSRIISRRALNSLLRMRENSRYLKANYAMVGYKTAAIPVEEPLMSDPRQGFKEQFHTGLVAITSFTGFLSSMLLWIFVFSGLVAFVAIFNAIKVKFTQVDIFGDQQPEVSGWAFLVVLISSFFAITCLNLYIMSIYLSNIYAEIKNRPLYIIESVKRY